MNYNKIMNFLAKGDKWQFDIPVSEQLKYIDKFPNPNNDIERSFFQYKSQMLFVGQFKRLAFNTLALFILPLYILVALTKRCNVKFCFKVEAILERSSHHGVVPKSLSERYKISSNEWASGFSLGLKDLIFLRDLFWYAFRAPYFVFKIIYKVGLYSNMIIKHRPDIIIVYNEYSYTSSALTFYCEQNNVEHINVMHGEKLYYIRDSFFRFTKAYVWEEYYIKLLSRMRAPESQFIAELPPFMSTKPAEHLNPEFFAEYKYYLATYTEDELKKIVESLSVIKKKGLRIKFRPHPRYSDTQLLKKYVDNIDIEYPNMVDIETSISNLNYGIGVYTTVLNQCYHAGKGVIIDDINFPENFSQLNELGYVLINKDIQHLSQLQ